MDIFEDYKKVKAQDDVVKRLFAKNWVYQQVIENKLPVSQQLTVVHDIKEKFGIPEGDAAELLGEAIKDCEAIKKNSKLK